MIVIVKDTETSSTATLSQVLGNANKRSLGDEYKKYEKRILAYIISLGVKQSTAEDLVQNVFIQSCYDYANGQKIKHFEGYLFGLARNIVHIHHRKENLLPTAPFLSDIEDMIVQSTINQPSIVGVKDKAYKAIAELPEKYQEALNLRYIQNLPLSVAAQHAGCSKNTFYQRIHIAINMLKTKLHSR
ncbi:MAG: RNA polymerase sigma factor [Planctomycetota bacterium]